MPDGRPNVLLIMADQFRHDYLGCAGADWVRTPNLDRLAERGVRFSTCTTNSAICAPARIGLAAGMQPSRIGALENWSYLPLTRRTYYQRLRDAGYRVGCVGKLDLAKPSSYNGRLGDRPATYAWGFTDPAEWEGKMHAGNHSTPQGPYGFKLQEEGLYQTFHEDYMARARKGWSIHAAWDSPLPAERFEDYMVGRHAADWIGNVNDDWPWHYFVSFVGPHDPFDPPTEYADHFRHADMPVPIPADMTGKPQSVARRVKVHEGDEDAVTETRRQYCASIEVVDDGVGWMLDALERTGQLDNTYIIFTSDHGEMLGDHGLYTKSVAYEGSMRVPLIACGPGIDGARTCESPVELIDVNPTICDLAGLPPQENIDARSFDPVLREGATDHREDAVMALRHLRCIRTARYKLIETYNDRTELYDLQEDPDEMNNVIEDRPDVARELNQRMTARYTEGRWER